MNETLTRVVAAFAALAVAVAFAAAARAGGSGCAVKKEGPGCDQQDCIKDAPAEVADEEAPKEPLPEAKPGTAAVKIPTIQCGMCVKTIAKVVKAVEGVTEVTVDKKAKVANVVFDPEKTTIEKIETAITKAGYDADDKKADPEAFKKLPDCCK